MTDLHHRDRLRDQLGPWPEATVTMFEDLGLAETEIARHLGIDEAQVRQLRQQAGTGASLPWLAWPAPRPPRPAGMRRWGAWLAAICDRLGQL